VSLTRTLDGALPTCCKLIFLPNLAFTAPFDRGNALLNQDLVQRLRVWPYCAMPLLRPNNYF
jgi:hypothetical protein